MPILIVRAGNVPGQTNTAIHHFLTIFASSMHGVLDMVRLRWYPRTWIG